MKKICLLFGSSSYEHEISIKSTKTIIKNIDKSLYNISICGISKTNEFYEYLDNPNSLDNNWLQKKVKKIPNIIKYLKHFDKLFPIIHGNNGEDGHIEGLLELFNIPYVGCNSESSILGYNKYLTKIICEKNNIPQLPYIIFHNNNPITSINLDFPVIIKPSKCGSSIGINIANNIQELNKYIKDAYKYDHTIIIEKYLPKRKELECAILIKENIITSSIGEIITNNNLYDYDSKYLKDTQVKIPANISNDLKEEIERYAKLITKILNLKDLSRIDFLYDTTNNKLYFNEVNTMPGFTSISMYPLLFNYDNLSTKDLITKLIED